MTLKTLEETRTWLKGYAEDADLKDEYEAAKELLEDFQMYDHAGEDRLFLAFCEEILGEKNEELLPLKA